MKFRSSKGWYIDILMMMMSLFLCGMSGKMGEDRKRGVKVKECVVLVGLVCNAVGVTEVMMCQGIYEQGQWLVDMWKMKMRCS